MRCKVFDKLKIKGDIIIYYIIILSYSNIFNVFWKKVEKDEIKGFLRKKFFSGGWQARSLLKQL